MEVVSCSDAPASVEALKQFLTAAKAEIACILESANGNENKGLASGEIQDLIHVLCEARSKFSGQATETTESPCHPSQSTTNNDADELKQQLKQLQEQYDHDKKQWETEKVLFESKQEHDAASTRQQETIVINSSIDTELLETIHELKEEVQLTRNAIQNVFSTTNNNEDEHIQSLSNGVREIQSSVSHALVELRQASAALKQTLAATRESLTEICSQPASVHEKLEKRPEVRSIHRGEKSSLVLEKQLQIEIKKRIRAEAEVEILNDQADAYMDQILDLQTENVQLILKADSDRNKLLAEEREYNVSDLVPAETLPSSDVPKLQLEQHEPTTWDHLPALVRNLYQRCEMLEAERQEVLESTVELLESSREANHAKVEAAYNEAMMEAERNFGLWLDHAVCKRCNSRFEAIVDEDTPPSRSRPLLVSSTQTI